MPKLYEYFGLDILFYSNNYGKDYETASVRLPDNAVISIVSVTYLEGYKLELVFSDGHQQVVDFEQFLRQSAHPQIQAYLDLAKFQQFTLEHGDLFWNDYELCFPIADLYENHLIKQYSVSQVVSF